MKGHTNNPNGRPRKAAEDRRKMVSYRLTPAAIEAVKSEGRNTGTSQSDVIMSLIDTLLITNQAEPDHATLPKCEDCPNEAICTTYPDRCGIGRH